VHEAGIASTVYALDGPGSNPVGGRGCPRQSRLALGPTQPTIKWVGYFPGVKQPGRGFEHPPSSSAEVKEIVQLYLYSPLGHRGLFISRPLSNSA